MNENRNRTLKKKAFEAELSEGGFIFKSDEYDCKLAKENMENPDFDDINADDELSKFKKASQTVKVNIKHKKEPNPDQLPPEVIRSNTQYVLRRLSCYEILMILIILVSYLFTDLRLPLKFGLISFFILKIFEAIHFYWVKRRMSTMVSKQTIVTCISHLVVIFCLVITKINLKEEPSNFLPKIANMAFGCFYIFLQLLIAVMIARLVYLQVYDMLFFMIIHYILSLLSVLVMVRFTTVAVFDWSYILSLMWISFAFGIGTIFCGILHLISRIYISLSECKQYSHIVYSTAINFYVLSNTLFTFLVLFYLTVEGDPEQVKSIIFLKHYILLLKVVVLLFGYFTGKRFRDYMGTYYEDGFFNPFITEENILDPDDEQHFKDCKSLDIKFPLFIKRKNEGYFVNAQAEDLKTPMKIKSSKVKKRGLGDSDIELLKKELEADSAKEEIKGNFVKSNSELNFKKKSLIKSGSREIKPLKIGVKTQNKEELSIKLSEVVEEEDDIEIASNQEINDRASQIKTEQGEALQLNKAEDDLQEFFHTRKLRMKRSDTIGDPLHTGGIKNLKKKVQRLNSDSKTDSKNKEKKIRSRIDSNNSDKLISTSSIGGNFFYYKKIKIKKYIKNFLEGKPLLMM